MSTPTWLVPITPGAEVALVTSVNGEDLRVEFGLVDAIETGGALDHMHMWSLSRPAVRITLRAPRATKTASFVFDHEGIARDTEGRTFRVMPAGREARELAERLRLIARVRRATTREALTAMPLARLRRIARTVAPEEESTP